MLSEPARAGSSVAPPFSNPFPADLVSEACISEVSEVSPENKETWGGGYASDLAEQCQ